MTILRNPLLGALVVITGVASAARADGCRADHGVYQRSDGVRFEAVAYGFIRHGGGRDVGSPGYEPAGFKTEVVRGRLNGKLVLSYIDTATGGTGAPGSSAVGEDPQWERQIAWQYSTREPATDFVPSVMASGPINEVGGKPAYDVRWALVGCRKR